MSVQISTFRQLVRKTHEPGRQGIFFLLFNFLIFIKVPGGVKEYKSPWKSSGRIRDKGSLNISDRGAITTVS